MVFDGDGDGKISADELRDAMTTLGDEPLTDEEFDKMISVADVNHDGHIDIKKLAHHMLNPQSSLA